ncbi:hypothetical protein [Longispora urticae]
MSVLKKKVLPLLVVGVAMAGLMVGLSSAASASTDTMTAEATSIATAAGKNPDQKAADCRASKTLTLRQKVACVATSQLGVKEDGTRTRKPTNCQKYFKDFGSSLNCNDDVNGQWCAAFTRWVWTKAGVKPVPASFGVDSWRASLTGTKSPQVGDVVLKPQHIMIVVKVEKVGKKTVVHTIDGNGGNDDVRKKSHTLGAFKYAKMGS